MPSSAARLSASIGASVIARVGDVGFAAPGSRNSVLRRPGASLEVGPADLDMRHAARLVAVREPGAAVRSFPHDVGLRGRQDFGRQAARSRRYAPGRRARPQARPGVPALGQRRGRARFAVPRRASGKVGATPTNGRSTWRTWPKFRLGIEVLHEVEDVALGRALRVPPAAAIVVDDQDLALARGDISGHGACFPCGPAARTAAAARAARRSSRHSGTGRARHPRLGM